MRNYKEEFEHRVSFIKKVLEESGAAELGKCPDLVRPVDFCSLRGLRSVRQGVFVPSPA